MKNLKKGLFIILMLLMFATIGCGSNEIEIKFIEYKDIFNQDGSYLVVFSEGENTSYLDEYCLSTKKGKVEYPVYVVNATEEKTLLKEYDGLDGQGVNGTFFVDGVTKLEDLYIASAPSLIKVSEKATFVAEGVDKIKAYLSGLVRPYELSFDLDGGKFSFKVDKDFTEPKEYALPIPEKEGYIFLGYKEENNASDEYINKLESKDYKLKAFWTERFEYETIEDSEVLKQEEDRYLVYVMKDNCPYCEKAKDSVLRYIYLQKNINKEAPKLYVVNITGSTTLKKSTPTLMEVKVEGDKKVSEDIVVGTTNVKNKLNEILYSKDEAYTISINYGDETKTFTFNAWEDPVFPEYKKEGYILLGYEENGAFLETVSKKSANLNAVFVLNEYRLINDTDIFNQDDNRYLVYFMKDGCPYCEKIKENIVKYQYLSTKEEYEKSFNLYVVNLKTGDFTSSILRKYSDEMESLINGVSKWDDLYIYATPTLIEINNGISKLVESGSTKISNALDNFLIYKDEEFVQDSYEVSFDLAYDNANALPSITYYKWQTASSLPSPKREGYIFLGWEKDGEVVTSVKESTTLKAKWVSTDAYKEIEDKDVFNQKPYRYLVYFKKDGCTYCERIEKDVLEYNLKRLEEEYKNSLVLYTINLKSGGYISPIISNRNYDDVHVDGVTDWEDLYVPSTPTLIEVYMENGVSTAKLIAVGSTKIVRELDDYLVKNADPVGEKKSYQITIDYGYDNKVETFEKYEKCEFVLPTLSRDGYVFVGYEENGKLITDIEDKDYNLKVVWKGIEDAIHIDDKDIYNQEEDEYYIIFVEKGSNTYNTVMNLVVEYQFGKSGSIPLYVVDVKDSVIKRSYTDKGGEGYNNKFYVTNAKSWDELYIYATPSMIKINKGESVTTTYLNCHLTSVKKFIENLLKD